MTGESGSDGGKADFQGTELDWNANPIGVDGGRPAVRL